MKCEFHMDVIHAFDKLCDALSQANKAILKDESLPCWMQPLDAPLLRHVHPRTQCVRLLNQLEYLNEQEGREILLGVGIFASSLQTLETLETLNQTKIAFKYAIQNLKCSAIKTDDEALCHAFQALLMKYRHAQTDQSLTRGGLSRLHLKQCYRQVPLLQSRPQKVSWIWANTKSIKKISKQQAIALLQKKGDDPGIQAQIMKASSLKEHDNIAIVQTLAPHLRTNIVLPNDEGNERCMLKGSLPLFYLHEDGMTLPEIVPPKETRKETRPTRSDVKINPEVFLPAIRGYVYTSRT